MQADMRTTAHIFSPLSLYLHLTLGCISTSLVTRMFLETQTSIHTHERKVLRLRSLYSLYLAAH